MTLPQEHKHKAALVERTRLSKKESSKEIWHLALQIDSPHFSYQVGDSLAVFAENDPADVEMVLRFFQLSPNAKYKDPQTSQERDIASILRERFDLAKVPLKLVRLAEKFLNDTRKEKLAQFVEHNTSRGSLPLPLRVFLAHFGSEELSFDEVFSSLPLLLPRYYSIASSPKMKSGQVDLTIATVSHDVLGEKRYGLCSHFLTERAPMHTPSITVFVHEANHFRLPLEKEAPILMVGPGTGIAPFRAFIQEVHHAYESPPPCWLFFGDRHQKSDFLYEDFLLHHQQSGSLRLDLAFSRDYVEKVYVQHKMWEKRKELASWIHAQGAYFYICGDAQMARDVEKTLHDIFVDQQIAAHHDDAKAYLKNMQQSKRYCRDVY